MNRVARFFEAGIYAKFFIVVEKMKLSSFKPSNKKHFEKQGIKSDAKFFDNVDAYIIEYTSRSDLKLANYRNIFLFYFLLCILILFVFVINCLIAYIYPAFILFRFIIFLLLK